MNLTPKCLLLQIALLGALLFPLGPVAQAQRAPNGICRHGVVKISDGLKVCGELTHALVDNIAAELNVSDKTIELTSPGGDSGAAIRLAKLIRRRDLRLRVSGVCLSSCAHFVFLSAPIVYVELNALVGFHHTSSFVHRAMVLRGLKSTELLYKNQSEEQAYFREIGISEEFLYAPGYFVQPSCIGFTRYNGSFNLYVKSKWSFIVPTRTAIEKIRRAPVLGFWPESSSEIADAVRSWGNINARYIYALGWPRMPSAGEMFGKMTEIPTC